MCYKFAFRDKMEFKSEKPGTSFSPIIASNRSIFFSERLLVSSLTGFGSNITTEFVYFMI